MSSARFVVLQKMHSERDILFGDLGQETGITKEMKMKKWMKIAELATELGIMTSKPWQYMRDTVWQNWKKRTVARKAANAKLTDIDELVLEIIQPPDPNRAESAAQNLETFLLDSPTAHDDIVDEEPIIKSKRKRPNSTYIFLESAESKKKQRIDLQIENLKIKGYKMRLEALELEIKLGLPRSRVTRALPEQEAGGGDYVYKSEQ